MPPLPDVSQLLNAPMVKTSAAVSASTSVTKASSITKESVSMEVASQATPPTHSEDVSDNQAHLSPKEEIPSIATKINLLPTDNVSVHAQVDSMVIPTQDNA